MDLETIFWTIIVCSALIIIISYWLAYKLEDSNIAHFTTIHQKYDRRTEALEKIQEDINKIKQRLDIYY